MIVLHYIPSLSKENKHAAKFVQILHAALSKTVDTHMCTGELSRREFLKILTKINPDVVHLHGCWNIYLSNVRRWSARRGYPVILSPYGMLSTKHMEQDFWKTFLPRIILYQYDLTRKVMLLHASSAEEVKELKHLGWKKRIAYISMHDGNTDLSQVPLQFRQLYQKTIDTHNRNRLNNLETKWFWHIIKSSLAKSLADNTFIHDDIPHVSLPSYSWRAMQIYAIDHGVIDFFHKGAETLQLSIPDKTTTPPSRFSVKNNLKPYSEQKQDKALSLQYVNHNREYILAQQFNILKHILCNGRLHPEWESPTRYLIYIYQTLQYTDIDEGVLVNILNDMKITEFSSRILQIISEYLGLTIGFMPIPPLNDSGIKKIKEKINNLTISTP